MKNVVLINNGILNGLNERVVNIKISNKDIQGIDVNLLNYCEKNNWPSVKECTEVWESGIGYIGPLYDIDYFFSQEIKVYDITSDKYNIDKNNRIISYSGEFNQDNITLTLEGLTGVVDGDKYIVKDGDVIVDTYTLINLDTSNNINVVTDNKIITTTKSQNKIKNSNKVITTTVSESKKEETTTENKIINRILAKDKTPTKQEVKKTMSPIVPIAIGVGVISVIICIGYTTYNRNRYN